MIRSFANLAILGTALALLPFAAGAAVLEIHLTEGAARRRSRARAERVAERGGRRVLSRGGPASTLSTP